MLFKMNLSRICTKGVICNWVENKKEVKNKIYSFVRFFLTEHLGLEGVR